MEALTDTELFRWLAALGWIDRVALGVVALATLRGLWIGLLREAFSVAALAAAFVAVKLWTAPATAWLVAHAPFDVALSERQSQFAGGALVGVAAAFVVVAIGGFVRKRFHANGLGPIDRLLGGVLGGAEGALVAAVGLIGVVAFVGPQHEVLAGSRSIELLSRARLLADELPNVAAPPPDDGGFDEGAPAGPGDEPHEVEFAPGDEVSV